MLQNSAEVTRKQFFHSRHKIYLNFLIWHERVLV